MRVDWSKLIEQLRDAGLTPADIASRLQIGERTVWYWKEAVTQPTHYTGERVIELYCAVRCVQRESVPVLLDDCKTFQRP